MENIIQAVSISFLHSIWQGMIIGIIAIVFLYSSKRIASAFRYKFLCLLLLIFIFSFGYTLWRELLNLQQEASTLIAEGSFSIQPLQASPGIDWKNGILDWCARNSYTIVMIWSFVFLLKLAMTIRSLYLLERLKQDSNAVSEYWQSGIRNLARKIDLKIKISFRESSLVAQPIMIGIFRPVVLFPIGLLNQLSMSEVEVILLHELAHIKRTDYFVNLLQHLVETVFFFNPALLWLSTQIRKEREYCCDEVAVKYSGKRDFMKALISFHEHQASHIGYAMAFTGKRSLLKNRVERIVQERSSGNSVKLVFSLLGIICVFGLLSYGTANSKNADPPSKTMADLNVPAKSITISTEPGKELKQEKTFSPEKKPARTKPEKLNKDIPIKRDTIPAGASADFIAGYKAAMNFKSGFAANDKNSVEKLLIEQQATKRIKDKENATREASVLREIEEKLRQELKNRN